MQKVHTSASPQERAAALIPILDAAAPRIEAERKMPSDVLAAMHDAGIFRVLLPKSVGGDEADLVTFAETIETIAQGDASAAWVSGQGGGCALSAAFLKPQARKKWFGPKNAVLAWGAGIQGKAVKIDGGYRVSGRWMFNSGSRHATILGGHSFVVDNSGAPILRANGSKLDRTVLIRRDQAKIDDNWHVMGLSGTGSDTFEIEDLFVAEEDTIDRENLDELQENASIYLFPGTVVYGVGFSALQLGIARRMLTELRSLAMTKTPRGVAVSLRENPVFQQLLSRLEARLRSARAYLMSEALSAQEAVSARGAVTLDERARLKLASVHCIHEGVDIVHEAYRAAGSTAIFKSGPFERRLRDALSASQQTQARAENFVNLGRILLDLDPGNTAFL